MTLNRKAQQKMSVLQQEAEAALSREQQANLHLKQVLEIAEKTAAERDSYAKMVRRNDKRLQASSSDFDIYCVLLIS